MATAETAKQAIAKAPEAKAQQRTLQTFLASANVRERFESMLGTKAAGFMSSIISVANQNKLLQEADPLTIIGAAAIAASLDLPINPNLGFAHIVPYKDGKTGRVVAQYQQGWKGFVQLGLRSGQYLTIHASEVYEDELESWNPLTAEFKSTPQENWKQREAGETEKIVGYLSFFKLLNGYEKYYYMTVSQLKKHGKRYSKSFDKSYGAWQTNFEAMALKTVVKLNLSKWGILSVQMERAISVDQGVIHNIPEDNEEAKVEYIDNPTGELFADETAQQSPAEV